MSVKGRKEHIHELNGQEMDPLNDHDGSVTIVLPPNEERAAWSNKLQFILSVVGYSVGLGNIWRFPYLCQQNGGGAFLIPYLIMLILEGIPLFLIELGIGQKMRLGSMGVWNNIHPWLGGMGIAAAVVALLVSLYYNVIITWCFFYLFNSFQSPLPWADCPRELNGTYVAECELSSSTAYFWYRKTLDVSPSMDDWGGFKWWIVLCLLLSWIVVYFIIMRGIQSSGKIVYFTALFPYIVLTIFFFRAITLKGSGAGLMHMYTPKLEKLTNPTVWLDAATQVFYSFGLAFGSLIAFGSYNPPNNNCVRDVILISITNAVTAIYASAVIFAVLGFKAMVNYDKCLDHNIAKVNSAFHVWNGTVTHEQLDDYLQEARNFSLYQELNLQNCSLEEQLNQAAEGTGLAFIVFTQAIVELPGAPFWSIIFFLMLLALGLGSQIGILEGVICTVFDMEALKRFRKEVLTGVICISCFFIGLIFTTGAGEYWLKLFDSFAGTMGLVFIALLEMFSVMYIYGHKKFSEDIENMTGIYPNLYWQITWRFIGPILMTVVLGTSIAYRFIHNPEYMAWVKEKGQTVELPYPGWVMTIAVILICAGILPIFVIFLLRRFQCLRFDVSIHQGAIKRIDTTASTKEMMADAELDEYHDDDDENGMGVRFGNDDDSPPPTRQPIGKTFEMDVLDC